MIVWFAAAIPAHSQGGVNRNLTGLAQELSSRGHDARLVYAGNRTRNYILFSLALLLRMLLCVKRPDFIIARSTDGFFCALASRALRLHTRLVLHNHGWEERVREIEQAAPPHAGKPLTTWKSRLVRYPMLRWTLRLSHRCICGTIDEIRWLARRFPAQRAKFWYIPNGVGVRQGSHWGGRAQEQPVFLCVGGQPWRKNLDYVLQVFAGVRRARPDALLNLVGFGRPLAGLHVGSVLQESVVVVPSESMDRMHRWYSTCPFMLAASRYEGGHSLALLEALSYGVAVFAVPIPSTQEFLRDGSNGIYMAGADASADADRILEVLADAALLERIRHNACRTALRNNWSRPGVRLARLLSEA